LKGAGARTKKGSPIRPKGPVGLSCHYNNGENISPKGTKEENKG